MDNSTNNQTNTLAVNEVKPLSPSRFEGLVIPKVTSSNSLIDADDQGLLEDLILEYGAEKTLSVTKNLTPEAVALFLEFFKERKEARIAVAKWNYFAKCIKWSFVSLMSTIILGYALGYSVYKTPYDIHAYIGKYIGNRFMRASWYAFLLASAHNVYDATYLQYVISKITEAAKKLTNGRKVSDKKDEEEEEKNDAEDLVF